MVDYRNEINNLAEECLHEFIEQRLVALAMEDTWKTQLVSFVNREYRNYPANYEYLHNYFSANEPESLNIRQLDVTAIVPLLLYFSGFSPLLSEGFISDASKSFKSRIFDFQYVRNSMKHYTGEIQHADRDRFISDQMNAICCILWFTLLCERYCPADDKWKEFMQRALYYQTILRKEKWFLVGDLKYREVGADSYLSDVEYLAEEGNTKAQLLLGKIHYEGKRFGLDKDKSFMWFYKASRAANAEAMYYMGKCYQSGYGVDYDHNKAMEWIKKAADLGYAAAQYEWGIQNYGKIDMTVSEKEEMVRWLNLSAEQKYPEALWTLGLCYQVGHGINQDKEKAQRLKEESAQFGYEFACISLAEDAQKQNDDKTAEHWYRLAEKFGSDRAHRALERYKKRGKF